MERIQDWQGWPTRDPLNLRNYALPELEGKTNIHVWIAEVRKALGRCHVLQYVLEPASEEFQKDPRVVESINNLMQASMSPSVYYDLEEAGRLTELTDDPVVFYTTVLDLFQPSHDEALNGFMTAEPMHYGTLKEYLHRIYYLNDRLKELGSWCPEENKREVILKALGRMCTWHGCSILNCTSHRCVKCANHRWNLPIRRRLSADLDQLFVAIAVIHDDETDNPSMVWHSAGVADDYIVHRAVERMVSNISRHGRAIPEAWFV
jgi:hypothetical protein